MERRPDVAVIQTVPRSFGRRSLFGRAQQFAGTLYTPIFAAGLHYWQLGDAPYWGHNAILRVAPFMEHCGLARLPGKPPLGGDILSHDFVEAALLARAGYTLWLAYDLRGQLGGDARHAARGDAARPPLVPGQPPAPAPAVPRGLLRARTARCSCKGALSYVSALIWLLVPRALDRRGRDARARRHRLLLGAAACSRSGRCSAPTGWRAWWS